MWFFTDRKTVRSVDRGCRIPEKLACGKNCCDENIYNVVCQYECEGTGDTVCNSRDVSKAPCGDTCGANDFKMSFTVISFLAIVTLFMFIY